MAKKHNRTLGRRTRIRLIFVSVFALIVVGFFQNCGGKFTVAELTRSVEFSSIENNTTQVPEPVTPASSKLTCQFIGPYILSDRLKITFHILKGDVPVLNPNGTVSTRMRIVESLVALGKGNVNEGRLDDWSCGTTKFKAAVEVMIDACAISLGDMQVSEKLFPSGVSGFDSLYHHLLGRLPTDFESDVLRELMSKMPVDKAKAAACGAVATSFESLIRI
jgi:hypothetical protein